MSTAVGRLVRAELKLMTRDPLVLTFVLVFPIVTMLIMEGRSAPSRTRDSTGSTRPTGMWRRISPS